jgi:hypothetical protein
MATNHGTTKRVVDFEINRNQINLVPTYLMKLFTTRSSKYYPLYRHIFICKPEIQFEIYICYTY